MNVTFLPNAAPAPSGLGRIPPPAQILLVAALLAAAAFLWSAPWRAERFYAGATLAQLQAEAARRPDDPRVLHHLALRLQEAGRSHEALDAALHAAERAPSDEDAYLMAAAFSGRVRGDQSAFDILTEFSRRHPRSARTHRALALLYQKNGAHERAFAEATKAATADPKDAAAFRIAADEALVMHKTDAAETNARQAVALAPNDPRPYLTLAAVLDLIGKADSARAAAEAAVKADPNDGEARLGLGGLLRRQNRREEALAQLTEAARCLPGNGGPPREIGRVQLSRGRYAAARDALEQARAVLPDDRTTSWLLGVAYRRLGEVSAAAAEEKRFAALCANQDRVEDLKLKISKGVGDEAALRHELAQLLSSHGDLAGAQQQYRLLILRRPDAAGTRHQLAALDAVAAGDIARARREAAMAGLLDRADRAIAANQGESVIAPLQAALAANPNDADLYNRVGRALGQSFTEDNRAESALVKAASLAPRRIDLALDAGEILAANQKGDAAEVEYRRALTLAPDDALVRGAVGRFLANERAEPAKITEGERLLRGLLAANPANPDGLYGLGMLELARGDGKSAAAYLEAFVSKTGQREWPDVWYGLSRAYRLAGDPTKAQTARAEYIRLTGQLSEDR